MQCLQGKGMAKKEIGIARGNNSAKIMLLELQWVRVCPKAATNCGSNGGRANRPNVSG